MRKLQLAQLSMFIVLIIFCLSHSECVIGKNFDKDLIYQVSTIEALLNGLYDGNVSFKELKNYGNFGLGTFNAIDGEMIELNNKFYQVKSDGKVYVVNDKALTPFAVVTSFEPDTTYDLTNITSLPDLTSYIDSVLPSQNLIYAIKINGIFNSIRVRSVPVQVKPYPPLTKVAEKQSVFNFNNIKGTIVGFRFPDYLSRINVAGYHLHFIAEDKNSGGHLLDCNINKTKLEVDKSSKLYLDLPQQSEFYNLQLQGDKSKEIKAIEK